MLALVSIEVRAKMYSKFKAIMTDCRVAKKPIQDTAVVASPRAKKTAPEPIASPRRSRVIHHIHHNNLIRILELDLNFNFKQ